ncbi:MAG TPA: VTT domain-containing protein [Luteitalea sp.]|nr:VTT domain-containing protein [Luteitalea sp.]
MLAYLALFAWSFLAATLVPIGSEAAVAVMVQQQYAPVAIVAVATVGNYLGACTTYWLARGARRSLSPGPADQPPSRATRLLAQYGQPALLLTWVPLIGDALVAVAGFNRVPFLSFSAWTFGGKLVRYVVVVWGAHALFS